MSGCNAHAIYAGLQLFRATLENKNVGLPTIRPDRFAALFRLHCSQPTGMQIYCAHIFLA
jgi:hypothetical protein